MDEQARAAFMQIQATCALIEAMGMQAKNEQYKQRGEPIPYGEEEFTELIDKHGISHNQAMSYIQGR